MTCQKCGSNWIEKSTLRTVADGLTNEWLCKKCGTSVKEEREMASTRGKCDNCERPDMALRKIGGNRMVCGTCILSIQGIPAGAEREKKLEAVAARILTGGIDKRKATNKRAPTQEKRIPEDIKAEVMRGFKSLQEVMEEEKGSEKAQGLNDPDIGIMQMARGPWKPTTVGDYFAPPPSNGDYPFPPITLKFEERDSILMDALKAEATKQRRSPDQHILWILEQHYQATPPTSLL